MAGGRGVCPQPQFREGRGAGARARAAASWPGRPAAPLSAPSSAGAGNPARPRTDARRRPRPGGTAPRRVWAGGGARGGPGTPSVTSPPLRECRRRLALSSISDGAAPAGLPAGRGVVFGGQDPACGRRRERRAQVRGRSRLLALPAGPRGARAAGTGQGRAETRGSAPPAAARPPGSLRPSRCMSSRVPAGERAAWAGDAPGTQVAW